MSVESPLIIWCECPYCGKRNRMPSELPATITCWECAHKLDIDRVEGEESNQRDPNSNYVDLAVNVMVENGEEVHVIQGVLEEEKPEEVVQEQSRTQEVASFNVPVKLSHVGEIIVMIMALLGLIVGGGIFAINLIDSNWLVSGGIFVMIIAIVSQALALFRVLHCRNK